MHSAPEGTTHIRKGEVGKNSSYKIESEAWWYFSRTNCRWAVSPETDKWHQENLIAIGAPLHDTVQNPKHYQLLPGVEVYDIRQALAAKATTAGATLDQFSDYDRALEYLLRMWEKNGVEDAQKAAWYLNKLVEKLNGHKG